MTDDLQKELEHLRTKVSIQDIALPRLTEAMVKSQARVKQLETDGNLMAMNLRILEGQLREANKKIAEAEADAERLAEAGTIQHEAFGACRNLIEALSAHRQRVTEKE